MDLAKIIADLQDERRRLDEAIEALERLSEGHPRRRGRPSKSESDTDSLDSQDSEKGHDLKNARLSPLKDRPH